MKCAAGIAIAATGIVGLKIAFTWAAFGFVGGIVLAANEVKEIADTAARLGSDEELARILRDFQSRLIAEVKSRR